MMNNKHPLHRDSRKFIEEKYPARENQKWIFDPACYQNMPDKTQISLFAGNKKDSVHRLCKVDGVLIEQLDLGEK